MFRNHLIIILITISLLTTGCNHEKKHRTLKLAHGLNTEHPVHKAMSFMAKRVSEISEGKMEIKIYPGGQLGPERTCVELLQIGSLDMTKVSAAVMEGFVPTYRVLGLPYIFRGKEHAYKVLDGEIGKDMLLEGTNSWLKGLCFYDAGSRSFYTKEKAIYSPDDLKGLKIRVMKSNTAVQMVRALGGSPTPISWGELYTALQGGVVDGAENNPPSFYLSHHYEVCKYYSLNEHTTVPDILLISTRTWNKLTGKEREWIKQAVKESAVLQRKLWEESEKEALKAVSEAGVKIIYPDKKLFAGKVEKLIDSYQSNEELYSYIQRIRSVD
ncbi:MAG: TRAP transporter substrate-binding protein [Bacteroidetes bacterium]|nr:TRAP transporter substrate-binding protein [Bacteroidota bacterium]